MIEKLINYFHKIHYCLFIVFVKIDFLFNKTNPFLLLFKIPFIQRYHRKHNWNPYEERIKVWNDKKYGFNIIIAGGILVSSLAGIVISLVFVINRIFKIHDSIPGYYIVICAILAFLISHIYVFKDHTYLIYFDKYKLWNKKQKRNNLLLTLLFIAVVVIFVFTSVFKK